ncbi:MULTISPECIES: DUF5313 family protein [Nocardiaceae]|uniref:DUF5313 domain-containing protein n=1 Tax=Rhodococcoides corynebacterioides TaxID=53972 RepID=A0ABS2KPX9_9NOCA|nr:MULTISPECIES: DUF5313 family protein [Rhodococcus]MBM7414019.1 hypothetical protein [Rhodococcus corynebacterioides]MBP1116482.1 hypothetical protein [Rhodococcus sp. PvP016]
MTETTASPSLRQRMGYVTGRTLPAHLHAWVVQDVTGPGATRRYATRCLAPLVPVLVALLFLPAPWLIRTGVVLLLFLPFVYFLLALKTVYLRHRLVSHGLDPHLLDARRSVRTDSDRSRYESRYRPAP